MAEPTGLMSYYQSLDRDALVNELYNRHIVDVADYGTHDTHQERHNPSKRIPYIGWFWRATDFVGKSIPIGDCGDFVGVMESNKWGYPQRSMTPDEVDTFISFIDTASAIANRSGNWGTNQTDAERVYNQMWDWFQTLRGKGDWG